jgi:hypothetical protein
VTIMFYSKRDTIAESNDHFAISVAMILYSGFKCELYGHKNDSQYLLNTFMRMSYNTLKLRLLHFNAYAFPHIVFRIMDFTVIINLYTFEVKKLGLVTVIGIQNL